MSNISLESENNESGTTNLPAGETTENSTDPNEFVGHAYILERLNTAISEPWVSRPLKEALANKITEEISISTQTAQSQNDPAIEKSPLDGSEEGLVAFIKSRVEEAKKMDLNLIPISSMETTLSCDTGKIDAIIEFSRIDPTSRYKLDHALHSGLTYSRPSEDEGDHMNREWYACDVRDPTGNMIVRVLYGENTYDSADKAIFVAKSIAEIHKDVETLLRLPNTPTSHIIFRDKAKQHNFFFIPIEGGYCFSSAELVGDDISIIAHEVVHAILAKKHGWCLSPLLLEGTAEYFMDKKFPLNRETLGHKANNSWLVSDILGDGKYFGDFSLNYGKKTEQKNPYDYGFLLASFIAQKYGEDRLLELVRVTSTGQVNLFNNVTNKRVMQDGRLLTNETELIASGANCVNIGSGEEHSLFDEFLERLEDREKFVQKTAEGIRKDFDEAYGESLIPTLREGAVQWLSGAIPPTMEEELLSNGNGSPYGFYFASQIARNFGRSALLQLVSKSSSHIETLYSSRTGKKLVENGKSMASEEELMDTCIDMLELDREQRDKLNKFYKSYMKKWNQLAEGERFELSRPLQA